jgi:8-hydroxy-5-deazaflavin:NADPH oxidoreductase
MRIAVIGTGFIGGILGRALVASGHDVVFGSRHPEADDAPAPVAAVRDALAGSDLVILAVPGAAVPELVSEHGGGLAGQLVIDATNQMGPPVANSRSALPSTVRYARAFNTLGGENMQDPMFGDERADMFFSAPAADRDTVQAVIEGVGLRPVYVGEDQEDLIDGLFRLWVALAFGQGRGRRLALRLLEG